MAFVTSVLLYADDRTGAVGVPERKHAKPLGCPGFDRKNPRDLVAT
jgi:hypothetical protein